jgi:DNA-binding response OmpR family regulator
MTSILIIEDDDQVRSMLRGALEREGYLVEEAGDGRQGLIRYRAVPTDLVITNILMPEQEGLETIRALRQEFPAVKIIAISGGGQRGTLDFLVIAQRLGAQRTLRKPFDLHELRHTVRELLQSTHP